MENIINEIQRENPMAAKQGFGVSDIEFQKMVLDIGTSISRGVAQLNTTQTQMLKQQQQMVDALDTLVAPMRFISDVITGVFEGMKEELEKQGVQFDKLMMVGMRFMMKRFQSEVSDFADRIIKQNLDIFSFFKGWRKEENDHERNNETQDIIRLMHDRLTYLENRSEDSRRNDRRNLEFDEEPKKGMLGRLMGDGLMDNIMQGLFGSFLMRMGGGLLSRLGIGTVALLGRGIIGALGVVMVALAANDVASVLEKARQEGLGTQDTINEVLKSLIGNMAETIKTAAKGLAREFAPKGQEDNYADKVGNFLDVGLGNEKLVKAMNDRFNVLTDQYTKKHEEFVAATSELATLEKQLGEAQSKGDKEQVAALQARINDTVTLRQKLFDERAKIAYEQSSVMRRGLLEMFGLRGPLKAIRDTMSEYWNNLFDPKFAEKQLEENKKLMQAESDRMKETNAKFVESVKTGLIGFFTWAAKETFEPAIAKLGETYWDEVTEKVKSWATMAKDWVLGWFDIGYWKDLLTSFALPGASKQQDRLKHEEQFKNDWMPRPSTPKTIEPQTSEVEPSEGKFLQLEPPISVDRTQDLVKPGTAKVASILNKDKMSPMPGKSVVNISPIRGGDTVISNSTRNTFTGYASPLANHSAANLTVPGRYSS